MLTYFLLFIHMAPSISTALIATPDGGGAPFYNAYLTCRYRIPLFSGF